MAGIPGAPDGEVWRKCKHTSSFTMVRAFHGIQLWQCLTCRKVSSVETRTDKTCLGCGKPLKGKQTKWCCSHCGTAVWNSADRSRWSWQVKKRDGNVCQRCGWKPADGEIGGRFQLESHHIVPLEWGGPEFDLDNGITYDNICHDEVHRELNAGRKRRDATV